MVLTLKTRVLTVEGTTALHYNWFMYEADNNICINLFV